MEILVMHPGSAHDRPADHTRFLAGSGRTGTPRSGSPSSLIDFPFRLRVHDPGGHRHLSRTGAFAGLTNAGRTGMIPPGGSEIMLGLLGSADQVLGPSGHLNGPRFEADPAPGLERPVVLGERPQR